MKTEQARIPITDFIKVWCELCRIRIDAREERTDVGVLTRLSEFYRAVNCNLDLKYTRSG